jgi:SipW-cognate class signal peptide
MNSVGTDSKPAMPAGSTGTAKPTLPTANAASRADDIVIGPGVRTSGKIQTSGSLFVDGTLVEAEIECYRLSVSQGGQIHGKVQAERIEIAGLLNGDAVATDEIVLRSSAVVIGKIAAPYIVVHRGAHLSGGVESTERRAEDRKPSTTTSMPLIKPRNKRPFSFLMGIALVGVLLGGGTYAWLSDTAQASQDHEAQVAASM